MVPKIATASSLEMKGESVFPFVKSDKNPAFTYAASSTPAGTLSFNRLRRKSLSL